MINKKYYALYDKVSGDLKNLFPAENEKVILRDLQTMLNNNELKYYKDFVLIEMFNLRIDKGLFYIENDKVINDSNPFFSNEYDDFNHWDLGKCLKEKTESEEEVK